jgi:hypothetical protein
MKINFNRDYLERLARISTPEWKEGMRNDERTQQCYDYRQLRDAAKDLLEDTADLVSLKKAENKVSELVKKLKIKI